MGVKPYKCNCCKKQRKKKPKKTKTKIKTKIKDIREYVLC